MAPTLTPPVTVPPPTVTSMNSAMIEAGLKAGGVHPVVTPPTTTPALQPTPQPANLESTTPEGAVTSLPQGSPAPASSSPPPPLPDTDVDFELRDPEEPVTTPSTAGAGEAVSEPVTTTSPAAITPTAPAPVPTAEEESAAQLIRFLNTTSPASNIDLPDSIRGAFLSTSRGKQILATYQQMRELGKPVEEGGLGLVPGVEQVREWYQAASELQDLTYKLETGDPNSTSLALDYLFATSDPSTNEPVLRPGMDVVASQLPHYLASRSPELYQRLASPIRRAVFDGDVEWVKNQFPGGEEGSDPQKARSVMVWAMKQLAARKGVNLGDEHFAPVNVDPTRRLEEENRRLRLEHDGIRMQGMERAWEGFTDEIAGIQFPRHQNYAEQALAAIKWNYKAADYRLLVQTFLGETANLLGTDAHYKREANPLLNRIRQSGSFAQQGGRELAKQVAEVQDKHLKRIVTAYRAKFISERGAGVPASQTQSPNGADNTALQQQATARYTNNGVSSSSPSPVVRTNPGQERFVVPEGMEVGDAIAADVLRRFQERSPR